MIVRLSRYLLIILTIFVAAVYLPQLYWVSFEPRIVPPMVFYSPVLEKFMIGHLGHGEYYFTDEDGNKYTRQQADKLLPLLNYRLLAARGQMPDSLLGQPITLEEIRHNNISMRITTKDINPPQIPVFPLFESKPPRLRLGLPDEYFRINEVMQFINAHTNRVVDSLTQVFSDALIREGFHFPARGIYGNPTTRKPYDAGYFIVDQDWQLFHLKKVHGKPYCKNISLPKDLKIVWISVKEKEIREFCGIAISEDNRLFLVMLDPERLQPLPVKEFNRKTDQIIFMGNIFFRWITIRSYGHSTTYLTDRQYNLLKTHTETWPTKEEMLVGKANTFIFPFELTLQSGRTYYINFDFTSYRWQALILNVVLMLVVLFFWRKELKIKYKWLDALIVLITGVFGFIGVLIFEHPDA